MSDEEQGWSTARPAVDNDTDAVITLLEQAAVDAKEKRGGEALLVDQLAGESESVRSLMSDGNNADDQIVVVGEFDGVLVGVARVRFDDLADGGRSARLTTFFVQPDARSVAVGESIMNLVQELASDRNCRSLDAYALPGDRDTKNFFESFGLKARLLVVSTDL